MTPIVTAAAGFLLAVLWFDLMFDVQLWRHRRAAVVPETVLDSISAYYLRATVTSRMSPLVALVMAVLLVGLVAQAVRGDVHVAVSVVSFALAVPAIGVAVVRTVRAARRLGAATDSLDVRSELARGIFRDHVVCFVLMAGVVGTQIGAAI